ncbi:MAG: signal peptidase II [Syntrophaceae bacterium]|nr:signal peptidase II [Syntrophaceae bacterium]
MVSKKHILFMTAASLVVLLDQVTKAWILATLKIHEGFPVIDGFFNIVHVRNPGAAFSFLASAPAVFRSIFFLAVTVVAILLILYYLRRTDARDWPVVASLAMILGGAAGNLIDRVRFGEVVDFLDVYIGAHHWPAFNVADSAISTGAVLLALFLFKERKGGATITS